MQMHGKRLPRVEFSSPEFCLPLAQNANPQPPVWNLDISNHNITKSVLGIINDFLYLSDSKMYGKGAR